MEVAKITSKGQITIPISIRRRLELNEGDKVLFIYKPDGVMMVNPNKLQGGVDGDVVEAAETEMAAEAVAALKERSAGKTAPKPSEPAVAAVVVPEPDSNFTSETPEVYEPVPEPASVEASPPQAPRPVPPPAEEPPAAPDKQIGGLNLGTLLDDIRSIGSKI